MKPIQSKDDLLHRYEQVITLLAIKLGRETPVTIDENLLNNYKLSIVFKVQDDLVEIKAVPLQTVPIQ